MNHADTSAPAARPHRTVLLVDGSQQTRLLTKWFLSNLEYSVVTARSAQEALSLFDRHLHDVVVTEETMPGISGTEMAHLLKLRSPSTPVLLYSGVIPEDCSSVDVVIQRPAHLTFLQDAIEKVLGPVWKFHLAILPVRGSEKN